MRGLLLFAHGARDERWAQPFNAVAARLHELDPSTPVALGFLEFMSPDLPTAGSSLVALGCSDIDIVPLFLGSGGHVRKDVPALLSLLQSRHPHLRLQLRTAIGERPEVIEAMARAALPVDSRARRK